MDPTSHCGVVAKSKPFTNRNAPQLCVGVANIGRSQRFDVHPSITPNTY